MQHYAKNEAMNDEGDDLFAKIDKLKEEYSELKKKEKANRAANRMKRLESKESFKEDFDS